MTDEQRYPEYEAAELTYPEVGATRALAFDGAPPPAGYRYLYRRIRLDHGPEAFAAAREVVRGWGMQRRAGARVYPPDTPPRDGLTVLVTAGIGPVPVTAPCRVVWTVDGTVDGAEWSGFGYGTLPGHPVSGEEAFLVHRDQADDVWCTILAFSRPAAWYAKLGGPLGRIAQNWMTARYLRAFRKR